MFIINNNILRHYRYPIIIRKYKSFDFTRLDLLMLSYMTIGFYLAFFFGVK